MTSPRVFIIRHGETEWSLNGRHTGVSDIPLTENGEKRIRATGHALVGDDRLIVPRNIAHIYVSPRTRAQRTLELLELGCASALPWQQERTPHLPLRTSANVEITGDIREWDYGSYEGITSAEIRELRKKQGLPEWDIWRDGCPDGESPEDVTVRLDRLIAEIRTKWQGPFMGKEGTKEGKGKGDVLLVAHGHILRAFAMRWVGKTLRDGPTFLLEAGGVGTLSYEHKRIEEPAILLGGAFMVDVVENSARDEKEREEEERRAKEGK
ncbi:phosphoglycerate mutase protein [Rutstroemia sp. NJR-2017a WRK4]|nr:phosphoglycerate mutase protein [Rutstroemia sp. NJR-2017a WRK4]